MLTPLQLDTRFWATSVFEFVWNIILQVCVVCVSIYLDAEGLRSPVPSIGNRYLWSKRDILPLSYSGMRLFWLGAENDGLGIGCFERGWASVHVKFGV